MTDTTVPTKYPPRRCQQGTDGGWECNGAAMAFIERPVCGVHGTEVERKLNRSRWDIYTMAGVADPEPPDDVIITHLDAAHFSVKFGFRSDAVTALKKVAGAQYAQEDKSWVFPAHRFDKVHKICERYFSEIVVEAQGSVLPATEYRRCLDWRGHSSHQWQQAYFCDGHAIT